MTNDLDKTPSKIALYLRRFAAAMSLLAGLAMCGLSVWAWMHLSPPMKAAIRATEHTLGTVKASASQMSRDLETLPQTLAEAERVSKSTALALRSLHQDLPGIFTEIEATGKTIADAGASLNSLPNQLRMTADGFGGLDSFNGVKAGRKGTYDAAGTLDLVLPQIKAIANTLTAISQKQRDPLLRVVKDSAAASEASAAWLTTIRTGVLPTIPRALNDLADSLNAVVDSLRTVPLVIDAFTALGLAFGIGFLASGLRQFVDISGRLT